jgi:hypothetical protein
VFHVFEAIIYVKYAIPFLLALLTGESHVKILEWFGFVLDEANDHKYERVLNGEEVLFFQSLFVLIKHLGHLHLALLLLSNESLKNTLILLEVNLQSSR